MTWYFTLVFSYAPLFAIEIKVLLQAAVGEDSKWKV